MFLPISRPREVDGKNEAEQSLNESPSRRWCSLFSLYKLFTSSREKKMNIIIQNITIFNQTYTHIVRNALRNAMLKYYSGLYYR